MHEKICLQLFSFRIFFLASWSKRKMLANSQKYSFLGSLWFFENKNCDNFWNWTHKNKNDRQQCVHSRKSQNVLNYSTLPRHQPHWRRGFLIEHNHPHYVLHLIKQNAQNQHQSLTVGAQMTLTCFFSSVWSSFFIKWRRYWAYS